MSTSSASRRRLRRPTAKNSSRLDRNRATRKKPTGHVKSRQASKPAARPARKSLETKPQFVMIPVRRIELSPWAKRLVYDDIGPLADSIRGDGETEGVGILEPVLVRPMARGRYELLDGARRWLAAKRIADERREPQYAVPSRIYNASDPIARLIATAAEGETDRRKPIEVALLYRELRDALEKEVGQRVSIRRIVGIGWHQRSMVHQYVVIGQAITRDMLRRAGIIDADGCADEAVIRKLSTSELLAIAQVPTVAGRVAALRAKADQVRGIKPATVASEGMVVAPSPEERLAQIRDGGLRIRVRAPIRTLVPAAASELVRQDLAPAMLAAVDQAHGGVGGDGYLAHVEDEHTILVLPREIEALSAAQLGALAEHIEALQKRVRRALRVRTQV